MFGGFEIPCFIEMIRSALSSRQHFSTVSAYIAAVHEAQQLPQWPDPFGQYNIKVEFTLQEPGERCLEDEEECA